MYENFKKLLEEKKLTSYRVSKETGIAQSTLSDWKNGKSSPKIDKLIKIADYLNVDVKILADDDFGSYDTHSVPEELLAIAKKASLLPSHQRKIVFSMLNGIIDDALKLINTDE